MKPWIDFRVVKEAADFRKIVEHYGLDLKAKGPELTGRCPFHQDTRPSLRINLEKQVFHCFGCSAKGNVLDFVSRKEGLTIRAAAELVARLCGLDGHTKIAAPLDNVPLPGSQRSSEGGEVTRATVDAADASESDHSTQRDKDAVETSQVGEAGNKVLTFALKLDPEHPYLRERGLTGDIIATFGIGFAKRGLMKGRIAIPIHDADGNLVAYAGRWPGEEIPEGEDRYKLPPGFKKSHVLFNLHRIRGAKEIVIVEGYFGTMRLHGLGIPAVALMGRTLSDEQRDLLEASGVRRLVVMLDGDEPGQQAADEIVPRLARRFFVRIIELPDGAQPDALSAEELRKLLEFK